MPQRNSQLDQAQNYATAEIVKAGNNPLKVPVQLRTVGVVTAAQGIIDNGGLQYFFESNFESEPPYSVFVDAYKEIGATAEADSLAAAASIFPFDQPHIHQERRNEFLDQFRDRGSHRPDSPFEKYTNMLCGNEEVWKKLEEYVARNRSAFPVLMDTSGE